MSNDLRFLLAGSIAAFSGCMFVASCLHQQQAGDAIHAAGDACAAVATANGRPDIAEICATTGDVAKALSVLFDEARPRSSPDAGR